VKTFNLHRPEDKEEYENILNSPLISHIIKEEFVYSKRTEAPLITVWYAEFLGLNDTNEKPSE